MSVTIANTVDSFSTASGTTLTNNIIAYWKLNESSSNFTEEVHGNTGVPTGIVYQESGKLSRCAEYDTVTDVIRVTNATNLRPTGDACTVSMWYYLDTLPSVAGHDYIMLRFYDASYDYGINITFSSTTNYVLFAVRNTGGTYYQYESANNSIGSTGTWYHLVCVNVGSGSDAKIYLNNSDITSYHPTVFSGNLLQCTNDFFIGNGWGASQALDGRIDEVGYWDRALTAGEISELYNSGSGKTYPFS